jgi:hypothetical protein
LPQSLGPATGYPRTPTTRPGAPRRNSTRTTTPRTCRRATGWATVGPAPSSSWSRRPRSR